MGTSLRANRAGGAGDCVVEVESLSKRYAGRPVVDSLSFSVAEGEIFGFLGPNGAGKTTTLRVLLGLAQATSGSVTLFGMPVPRKLGLVAQRVGAVVGEPTLYPHLSATDNVRVLSGFAGRLVGRSEALTALERVGLGADARRRAGGFSSGMRKRLSIAAALVHDPDLLVLDEPTTGLDPVGVRVIRELLAGLSRSGTTIILSSHQLDEVERLSSRVLLLRDGRSVYHGALDQLLGSGRTVRLRLTRPDEAEAALRSRGIPFEDVRGSEIRLGEENRGTAVAALLEAGIDDFEISSGQRSLEEAFHAAMEGQPN